VNVQPDVSRRRDQVDAEMWTRLDMRRFLALHELGNVYHLLHKYGMSQRGIAARTGHTQSEVSEIMAGRRRVVSYELLLRIALGLPRGWMGLDYDPDTRSRLLSPAGGEE
jgi:predicted XRE-type DNA-binding protein